MEKTTKNLNRIRVTNIIIPIFVRGRFGCLLSMWYIKRIIGRALTLKIQVFIKNATPEKIMLHMQQ